MSVNWVQTPLTLAQLQHDYHAAVRILRAAKAMRRQVFRHKPVHLVAKVGEIDQVLAILTRWQAELKAQLAPAQPELFGQKRYGIAK